MKMYLITRKGKHMSVENLVISRKEENAKLEAKELADSCVDNHHTYNVYEFITDDLRCLLKFEGCWGRKSGHGLIASYRKGDNYEK